jgi:hypothetical protein
MPRIFPSALLISGALTLFVVSSVAILQNLEKSGLKHEITLVVNILKTILSSYSGTLKD